jgi:hypothetical protein
MTDWLAKHHHDRCECKRRFRKPETADRAAEKASRKTGDLIITYQCFDCGKWHIGHADPAQRAARGLPPAPQKVFCVICGKSIHLKRIARARARYEVVDTCSAHCAERQTQQQSPPRNPPDGPVS